MVNYKRNRFNESIIREKQYSNNKYFCSVIIIESELLGTTYYELIVYNFSNGLDDEFKFLNYSELKEKMIELGFKW